jgi:hypothetical protein
MSHTICDKLMHRNKDVLKIGHNPKHGSKDMILCEPGCVIVNYNVHRYSIMRKSLYSIFNIHPVGIHR